ncbi:MAG: hypothetical protein HY928_11830 [Elusimicrobia bacterium]|nr:hypothetical protein [Elusimicrobiota bacterium]
MNAAPPRLGTVLRRQAAVGALAAAFLALMVLAPHRLERLAVEDGPVEWLTVGACLAAGAAFAFRAVAAKGPARLGAALAAAFCIFVAGEEVSWGQRLLGFMPPEVFLRENVQQESSLHNILQSVVRPKWAVILLLASWGFALPLSLRSSFAGLVPAPARETAPPTELAQWSAAGVVLLLVYPVEFSGEFAELLTALILLEAGVAPLSAGHVAGAYAAALLAGGGGLLMTDLRPLSQGAVHCAQAETKALAAAVASAALDPERAPDSLDKRMYRAAEEGYIKRLPLARAMEAAACPDDSHAPLRRTYLVDPWGQPYRLRLSSSEDGTDVATVYSAGPNRRLDDGGDDVRSSAALSGEAGVFLEL